MSLSTGTFNSLTGGMSYRPIPRGAGDQQDQRLPATNFRGRNLFLEPDDIGDQQSQVGFGARATKHFSDHRGKYLVLLVLLAVGAVFGGSALCKHAIAGQKNPALWMKNWAAINAKTAAHWAPLLIGAGVGTALTTGVVVARSGRRPHPDWPADSYAGIPIALPPREGYGFPSSGNHYGSISDDGYGSDPEGRADDYEADFNDFSRQYSERYAPPSGDYPQSSVAGSDERASI